jgi:hypothetical protein
MQIDQSERVARKRSTRNIHERILTRVRPLVIRWENWQEKWNETGKSALNKLQKKDSEIRKHNQTATSATIYNSVNLVSTTKVLVNTAQLE